MKLKLRTPTKHDAFGPSTHPMLVLCPGYRPKREENEHMRLGTFKHDLVNNLYNENVTIEEILNDDVSEYYKGTFTDQDRSDVVKAYHMLLDAIEWFKVQIQSDNIMAMDETFLPLEHLGIEGGTPDLVVVGDFTHIFVPDYKFGGSYVSAETEQIKSLMTKLVRQYPEGRIFQCIIQPVLRDDPLVVELNRDIISKHEEMMKWIILAAQSDNAPCIPNRYCGWCNRNPCAAVRARASMPVKDVEHINLDTMPPMELAMLTHKATQMKDLAGSCEQTVAKRLMAGEKIPGFYMSEGVERRQYIEEEMAAEIMRQCVDAKNANLKKNQKPVSHEDIWQPRKLKGISDMEKVVGKSKVVAPIFQRAVVKKRTSPQLRHSPKELLEAIKELEQ